jgi:hypothetical protein
MTSEVTTIGGIPTPVFYPSVSSVSKNVWSVMDHVELLVSLDYPQFLVSCFDIDKFQKDKRLHAALDKARDQCQVVLWDSGIYEVAWSRSKRWNYQKYIKTLNRNQFSHAFSFDDYCLKNQSASALDIANTLQRTAGQIGENLTSPIIHCRDLNDYPELCKQISIDCTPELIAIPERELGFGVCEIASNIVKIRNSLNSTGKYQVLHILGTGNPISMLLYSLAGADSFDGLDWCQTVVDFDTGQLHHPLQFDFFNHQSEFGYDVNMSFLARCYSHNLEFYRLWMDMIKNTIKENNQEAILRKYLPDYYYHNNQDFISSIINNRAVLNEALAN